MLITLKRVFFMVIKTLNRFCCIFSFSFFFSSYAIDTMLRWGRKHWKREATSYPTSGNDIIALSTFIKSWTLGSLEPFFSSATVGPVGFLVIQLVALVGNMKRILCSDWLPEWARWAHLPRSGLPALIPFKKKKLREADWQRTKSAMETQAATEDIQNKGNISDSRVYFAANTDSFLFQLSK